MRTTPLQGHAPHAALPDGSIPSPSPLPIAHLHIGLRAGRATVAWGQRLLYRRLLSTHTEGAHHVPADGGFLVAANHASHLDAGLIKMALGNRGSEMRALAAQDYFFAQAWSRWYFERLTNVLPFERTGGFRGSLKRAMQIVEAGMPLLVFPEGTRSVSGCMAPFKPAVTSMALSAGTAIVPVYVWGTFNALPKGASWPRARRIGARVGPPLGPDMLAALTAHLSRHDAYRLATQAVEMAVTALRDGPGLSEQELLAQLAPARAAATARPHAQRRRPHAADPSAMVGIA